MLIAEVACATQATTPNAVCKQGRHHIEKLIPTFALTSILLVNRSSLQMRLYKIAVLDLLDIHFVAG